ncbi:hypothetical protein [Streptomyces sp. AC512_CC834]|uniref:hypothetical protein n=1 Tax=Streptomyces sp. AC512_CC834 TaxID=2823691 RepID=UPI0020B7C353|nr:hypothetical protein [Streptomyces sp. AC512_CC834]
MHGTGTARTGRPREVETAFTLSLVTIAVNVAAWVLGAFVLSPTGFDELRGEMGQRGAVVQILTSAGFLLVVTTLRLVFAFRVRAGRNWARFVVTLIGVLGMFFLLASMSMDGLGWQTVTEDVGDLPLFDMFLSLLDAGVIVLLFLPAANAYFSAGSRTD